jgi:hypothetical protein
LGAAKRAGADEKTTNSLQEQINDQLFTNAEDAKQASDDAQAANEERQSKLRDHISALFEYRRSLTDDPVKLARLDEGEAGALSRVGGDPNQQLRDRAARNQAVRSRQQAIRDGLVDTLEYRHDIGKITDDAYIRGLEKIWRGMTKGTQAYKEFGRKIGRAKHDLEGADANFPQLDVGNIRLPTAYDIRRMIRQGTQTRSTTNVNQNNTYNFAVRSEADVHAIGGQLEQINGTTVRAGMRASGMRG